MKRNESLLDALLELQALDRVPRTGYLLRGVSDPESVAEHGWHVAFLVWTLARQIPGIDAARAVELALIHDLSELRVGDLPRTSARYFPRGAKKEAEARAHAEILAPLGEDAADLYAEYSAGASPEARLVRACDKLQLMLKVLVYERWGATGLGEFWDNPQNFPEPGFEPVDRLMSELRERREGRRRPSA